MIYKINYFNSLIFWICISKIFNNSHCLTDFIKKKQNNVFTKIEFTEI